MLGSKVAHSDALHEVVVIIATSQAAKTQPPPPAMQVITDQVVADTLLYLDLLQPHHVARSTSMHLFKPPILQPTPRPEALSGF